MEANGSPAMNVPINTPIDTSTTAMTRPTRHPHLSEALGARKLALFVARDSADVIPSLGSIMGVLVEIVEFIEVGPQ